MSFRRKNPKRKSSITSDQVLCLLYCCHYHFDYWPRDHEFRCDADRKRAWEAHKDRLMGMMGPGQRCGAFWDYEVSADQRPMVIGYIPFDKPMKCYHTGRILTSSPRYEDDRIALERNGLLKEGELRG